MTSVKENDLLKIGKAIHQIPIDFNAHKKIKKIYEDRLTSIQEGKNIDWSTAESLAFATLLKEGYGVRLSGQDTGRGTFSQRHAVLYDQINEKRFVPLRHFIKQQGYFEIIDSFLSEYGVLDLNMVIHNLTLKHLLFGRHNSEILQMEHKPLLINLLLLEKENGYGCQV